MDEVGVGNRGGRKRGEVVVGVARDVAGLVVSLKVVETARDVEGDVTLDLFISLGQSSLSFPLILQPSPFLSFLRFLFLSSHYTSPPHTHFYDFLFPHFCCLFFLTFFLLIFTFVSSFSFFTFPLIFLIFSCPHIFAISSFSFIFLQPSSLPFPSPIVSHAFEVLFKF